MKMIQVKLSRKETYAWCGCGMEIESLENGIHILNGKEISSEEKNRILNDLEQAGVQLIAHPDFAE